MTLKKSLRKTAQRGNISVSEGMTFLRVKTHTPISLYRQVLLNHLMEKLHENPTDTRDIYCIQIQKSSEICVATHDISIQICKHIWCSITKEKVKWPIPNLNFPKNTCTLLVFLHWFVCVSLRNPTVSAAVTACETAPHFRSNLSNSNKTCWIQRLAVGSLNMFVI